MTTQQVQDYLNTNPWVMNTVCSILSAIISPIALHFAKKVPIFKWDERTRLYKDIKRELADCSPVPTVREQPAVNNTGNGQMVPIFPFGKKTCTITTNRYLLTIGFSVPNTTTNDEMQESFKIVLRADNDDVTDLLYPAHLSTLGDTARTLRTTHINNEKEQAQIKENRRKAERAAALNNRA